MQQSILLNYLASQRTGKQERSNCTFLLSWCCISMTNINLQLHLVCVKMAVKAHPAALPLLVTAGTASTEGVKGWTKSHRGAWGTQDELPAWG